MDEDICVSFIVIVIVIIVIVNIIINYYYDYYYYANINTTNFNDYINVDYYNYVNNFHHPYFLIYFVIYDFNFTDDTFNNLIVIFFSFIYAIEFNY